ncbi:hypothetical protein AMTRI_Chr03g44820 [Amborella trichopoda]
MSHEPLVMKRFSKKIMVGSVLDEPKPWTLAKHCADAGNPVPHRDEKEVQHLRKAMKAGHSDSIYALGLIQLSTGDLSQGVELMERIEKQSQNLISYRRKNTRSTLSSLWINEGLSWRKRNCRNPKCMVQRSMGWDQVEDTSGCRSVECRWNWELNRFCKDRVPC